MKTHPEDYWKSSSPKPNIVIGTTAHAAYDESTFKGNLTEEEVVKYVEDSKIGSLNLTEKALELYGKTKEGRLYYILFKILKCVKAFISLPGLISMISDIRIVCPLLVQARSQSNYEFYVATQPIGEHNLATIDADILAILGEILNFIR